MRFRFQNGISMYPEVLWNPKLPALGEELFNFFGYISHLGTET